MSDGETLKVDCFDNFMKWNVTSVEIGSDALTDGADDVFDLGLFDFGFDDIDVFCWWSCDDV